MADNFQVIDAQAVKKMVDAGDVTVIDIRDPESYQEAHIDKALNLRNENLQDFLASASRKQKLICYCYHGISSQQAAAFLSQQGFTEVYSLEGGFEAWRQHFLSG